MPRGQETDTYFTDVRCMMVEKCLKVKNCQNKYVSLQQKIKKNQ